MNTTENRGREPIILPLQQMLAIKRAINLGRVYQEEHPDIADLYRAGKRQHEIVDIKSFDLNGVSTSIARGGVQNALSGHKGGYGVDPYEGLLSEEEREEIREKHLYEGRGKGLTIVGRRARDEGLGIFALSDEERIELSRENGYRTLREGKGVHGLSREQRLANSRKAILARGKVPWIRVGDSMPDGSVCQISESEYAYLLSQQQEYRMGKRVSNKKVAAALNGKYGMERKTEEVKLAIQNFKRRNLSKLEA